MKERSCNADHSRVRLRADERLGVSLTDAALRRGDGVPLGKSCDIDNAMKEKIDTRGDGFIIDLILVVVRRRRFHPGLARRSR